MVRQTRGKTKPNRHSLWLAWFAEQYNQLEPFCDRSIIDLGYGEKPYSVFELHEASRGFASPPSIIGIERAHHRHQQALAERHPEISFILDETVEFCRYQPPPKLIRALNVLRQYPPSEVASIRRGWLATSPGDVLLTEGTTDRDGDTLAMWCQSNDAPSTLVFGQHHVNDTALSVRRGLSSILGSRESLCTSQQGEACRETYRLSSKHVQNRGSWHDSHSPLNARYGTADQRQN
ncbi:MAG: hypothetical protein VX210_16385 [Myxococcota bacterium]|nr:hypothetical protein [Myxococcota bacterium]